MTDASERILAKVRGLLAKAADSSIGPEEADLFRQKADELMVKYAISSWQLKTADANDRDIIGRKYDFSWYSESEHAGTLWSIMLRVSRHCRVKIVTYRPDWYNHEIPVVGLKSDLDWFDLLFTNIMADFIAGLEPRPNRELSFDENVAALKESGMKWLRIAELLFEAEMLPLKYGHPNTDHPPTQQQVHAMGLGPRYTRFCSETNRPRLRVTPAIYRRSYSAGYDDRLWERLSEMRRRTQRVTGSDNSGTELVLADIWTRVQHQTIVLYGQPPENTGGSYRAPKSRPLKYSQSAANDGRARADKVRLTASNTEITLDKKELDR